MDPDRARRNLADLPVAICRIRRANQLDLAAHRHRLQPLLPARNRLIQIENRRLAAGIRTVELGTILQPAAIIDLHLAVRAGLCRIVGQFDRINGNPRRADIRHHHRRRRSRADRADIAIRAHPLPLLDRRLLRELGENANRDVHSVLEALVPRLMAPVLAGLAGIPTDEKAHSVTRAQRRRLLETLKGLRIDIAGPRPVEEAIVTAGGVKTAEVDPSTMASKKAPRPFSSSFICSSSFPSTAARSASFTSTAPLPLRLNSARQVRSSPSISSTRSWER